MFKVTFNKEPEVDACVILIDDADWANANVTKKRKVIRSLLKGKSRTLVGRLNLNAYRKKDRDPESLGRMFVVDLEKAAGEHNERQVDLCTVTELVVDGVRYYV